MINNETKPYKVTYSYFDENLDEDTTIDFMIFAKTLTEIDSVLETNNVIGGSVKSVTALPDIVALY